MGSDVMLDELGGQFQVGVGDSAGWVGAADQAGGDGFGETCPPQNRRQRGACSGEEV
jgi:hypothetical protein